MLAVTTLSFDIAGLELYLPLVSGGKIVVASREDAVNPRRLIAQVRDSGCTMLQATPATWRMLIEADWEGSPRLKALCGGEAMPPDLAQALLPRCAELWNMYGPTETTVWSTVHRIYRHQSAGTIGRPSPIPRPTCSTRTAVSFHLVSSASCSSGAMAWPAGTCIVRT